MNKTLLFAFTAFCLISCQKEITSTNRNADPLEKKSVAQSIQNDQLLIDYCELIFESQQLVKEEVMSHKVKVEDIQAIDVKKLSGDQDLINALNKIGFEKAEQYVSSRKQQEQTLKLLHKKYPELSQFTPEEWTSTVGAGFKKVYESKGMKYFGTPAN